MTNIIFTNQKGQMSGFYDASINTYMTTFSLKNRSPAPYGTLGLPVELLEALDKKGCQTIIFGDEVDKAEYKTSFDSFMERSEKRTIDFIPYRIMYKGYYQKVYLIPKV